MRLADDVATCASMAISLEACAYPKPGNVDRLHDFSDTKLQHFLATASAVFPWMRRACWRGYRVGRGTLPPSEAALGQIIKGAVLNMLRWQKGGNTSLGSIILLVPLSAAAGACGKLPTSLDKLRDWVGELVEATTPRDAIEVYEAIRTVSPGGLGKVKELDVMDPSSTKQIAEKQITLYQIFERSSHYDAIAREWVTKYRMCFEVALPELEDALKRGFDFSEAIAQAFIKLLATSPDTLIARKAGWEEAERVAKAAKEAYEAGGVLTDEGCRRVLELDRSLRKRGNLLNPGSTADIACATSMIALLRGAKP